MNRFFKDNKYTAIGVTAFLTVCASAFAIYVIFHFSTILGLITSFIRIMSPIINGIALAYILTPVLNFVEQHWVGWIYKKRGISMDSRKKRSRRGLSILVTYAFFFCLLYLFFRLVIPQLINSIRNIIYQLPKYVNNLQVLIDRLIKGNPELESTVNSVLDSIYDETTSFLQNTLLPQTENILRLVSLSVVRVFKTILNIILGFIISIYLMYSKELMAGQAKKIAYALLDTKEANRVIAGVRYTHRTFTGFLSGKLIDSVIIGVLCFIVISLVDIPYAILVSVIVGVTNIIPFFGPYIGAIPSTILVLMIDPLKALYFVIIILILQQLDGNVIGPKILGDSTGLSSFWVIFAITVFGGMFGVAGWILGVPTFGVLYALVKYKINRTLRHKDMPQDTASYINVGSVEKDGSFIEYVPVKPRGLLEIIGLDKKSRANKNEMILDEDDIEMSGDDNGQK